MGAIRVTSHMMVYKIDASRCDLQAGDVVTPDMALGEDPDTGAIVKAETHGQVEGVHFNGANHALVILVRTGTPPVQAKV